MTRKLNRFDITLLLLSVLYLAGIWISDHLIWGHIELKLGNTADSGLCSASAIFSCKEAAQSSYSEIMGLPIAVLGQAYYACALLTLVFICFIPRLAEWRAPSLRLLGLTAALSALYSLFLGGVSYFQLGKLCPYCMGLYAVNILGLLALWWAGACHVRLWWGALAHRTTWIIGALMGLTLILSQSAYAIRYNQAHKELVAAHKPYVPKFKKLSAKGAPVRGETRVALLTEFADFECPHCRNFSRYLKRAFEQSATESRPFSYAFRHYPMSNQCNPYSKRDMHPRACHAAIAAICAQEQGKFWELHDLMFANRKALSDADLKRYATEIGLDMGSFSACISSERAGKRLREDIEIARGAGVRGTPMFAVNGWTYRGAKRPTSIKKLILKHAYGESVESQDLPDESPKTSRENPKTSSEIPKTSRESPKTSSESPKTSSESPKTPHENPAETAKDTP